MSAAHDATECFFNNKEEEQFLFDTITPESIVLEWGCGASTIAIAKRCKKIYSIEHDERWYKEIRSKLPDNAALIHKPRNSEEASGHDGTLENYYDYVNVCTPDPSIFSTDGLQPDVVLIDGRARVECAKVAAALWPDATIFIHDYKHPQTEYRRYEYEVVEEFLEHVGQVFAMGKFKVQ